MDNKKWFKEAQFGMMIHWGLYTLPAGEWKCKRMTGIGEWIQQYYRIPNAEYHELAKAFNPVLFNAEDWVKLAKSAGMRYMVVTAKHHEGFALYRSQVSRFNIYDGTPFRRDVIAEIAEACYKHGLKLGLYYSQDLDWSEPNGGGWQMGKTWSGCGPEERELRYWVNNWDFPDDEHKDYAQCFRDKIKPQVKELLTNYGDLCLIWFDTPSSISTEQSMELYHMVKQYQPDCLVNSRIGNGVGDYRSMGDNEIPDAYMAEELVETPATLNDTWGYKSFDNNWKDAARVRAIKKHLNDRGVNYLLNVGPDSLGRIPAPAAAILKNAGK